MQKPVTQEELDFVACESDRFESERIKWKNKLIQQAVEQTEKEYERAILAAKEETKRKYEEAERRRIEKYSLWQKFCDELNSQYERERLKRQKDFQAEQTKWRQEAEKYERELQAKREAKRKEELKRQLEEEQKKKQVLAAIKAQEDEKRQKEEAIKADEEKKKLAKENEKLKAEKKALNRFASDDVLKEEERYRQYLKLINESIAKNSQLKQASLESRKGITLALNTLTNDRRKIIDIAEQLDRMFKNARHNQQLYYFILNYTAKGIVKHAEVDVLSNEAAAFPFAHVTVLISTEHPDFMEKFMMPRFVKKCPYVLPRYYAMLPNNNIDEFRKLVGYKQNEDRDAYFKRMCAILALYCAIMQAVPLIPNRVNPYSMDHAWTWLARLLNLPPQKITPFLLYIFLKIAGSQMIQVYKGQARKLFLVVYKVYVQQPPPEVKALLTSTPAAMSRLKTFLEDASQKGFTEPEGSVPK